MRQRQHTLGEAPVARFQAHLRRIQKNRCALPEQGFVDGATLQILRCIVQWPVKHWEVARTLAAMRVRLAGLPEERSLLNIITVLRCAL